ncbi:MAG: permease, partial [Candidatus Altiarchaeota archaeon]|nr:permease [Candidatus Altiarchaeota archaeon]
MADIATGLITGNVIAALAAALGIASTGYFSAKGLEMSGNAAAGVTGEDEENFSAALILEALPQTQVVYGFIISVL